MADVILVAIDVRSAYNVGSFFRTCDGLGIRKLYICGTSPYPKGQISDTRLPHVADRADREIHKTALDAENYVEWEYMADFRECLQTLRQAGYRMSALEQAASSTPLEQARHVTKRALIVGNEPNGLPHEVLQLCDECIEIPMFGKKESFNVSIAAAIALYRLSTGY